MADRTLLPLLLIQQTGNLSPRGSLVGRTRLVKLVFLSQKEAPQAVETLVGVREPYPFRRHYYGPYSDPLMDDLNRLAATGLVIEAARRLDDLGLVVQREYTITAAGRQLLVEVEGTTPYNLLFERVVLPYGLMPTSILLQYVYTRYLKPEDRARGDGSSTPSG